MGAEAAGQVRLLRQRLTTEAAAVTAAFEGIPHKVLTGAAFRSHKHAAHDWACILAAMPPPILRDRAARVAHWRLLRPVGRLLAGDSGDTSVVVKRMTIGRVNGGAVRDEDLWGLAFADHALARVLERSGFRADPLQAMLDAHDLLLGASAAVADTLTAAGRWAIPGGPGAFLATMRQTDDGGPPMVALTAETWVSADQLWPEQEAQVAAIRFRQNGPTLGGGLLRTTG